jgi:FdhD protein
MTDGLPELRRNVVTSDVIKVDSEGARKRTDRLAGEEPLEIRLSSPGVDAVPVAVTMRTPGKDFELATGFLFTEGLIAPGDVVKVSYCEDLEGEQTYNVVTVRTRTDFDPSELQRNFYASSSCGICGKASIDQIATNCKIDIGAGPQLEAATIAKLGGELRSRQEIFEATGGLHAAGLFDQEGNLERVREDIGRHNAVDKLIGSALLKDEVPLHDTVLMVSGRAGFEIVQKAAVASIPVVCAVSAPSSLAVETAAAFGMTLIGFVRGETFNVYTGAERLSLQ